MEIKFLQQAHVSGIDKPKQRIGFSNIWVIMCFLNGVNYHAVPRQLSCSSQTIIMQFPDNYLC